MRTPFVTPYPPLPMLALAASHKHLKDSIALPGSKSESNRALIIQHLSSAPIELHNLSDARDTQTMVRLLESEGHVLDVVDAGTTMRFLTAFFSTVGRDQILTGTPRMCKRPIGILVDALRELGAEIEYWKQEGYPPLHIVSKGQRLHGGEINMPGDVSSQFISAILMIAPMLSGGVALNLTGNLTSRPYLEMTRKLMAHFGVETHWNDHTLQVAEQAYTGGAYTIESDWSAASYWLSFAALADEADFTLKGLRRGSLQGDQAIIALMAPFGVQCVYTDEGLHISKGPVSLPSEGLTLDFTEVPDLAQTMAVVAAATGTPMRLKGLHTLRIKETDRIDAIAQELTKTGVSVETEADALTISGKVSVETATIETYEDHRMAMAFAPLTYRIKEVLIKDPEVVVKSYPKFWEHVTQVGIQVKEW